MRPLLLSGLLCAPAVAMLTLGWPLDPGKHADVATVAPAPAVAVSVITVSLPSAQRLAAPLRADLDAWELVWDGSLAAAPPAVEPAPPIRKPARVLHAKGAVRRAAGPIVVVQQPLPERPDTVWTRVAQWLTRHEGPRAWTPDGSQGMGS